jgi:hypothetical protein
MNYKTAILSLGMAVILTVGGLTACSSTKAGAPATYTPSEPPSWAGSYTMSPNLNKSATLVLAPDYTWTMTGEDVTPSGGTTDSGTFKIDGNNPEYVVIIPGKYPDDPVGDGQCQNSWLLGTTDYGPPPSPQNNYQTGCSFGYVTADGLAISVGDLADGGNYQCQQTMALVITTGSDYGHCLLWIRKQ